MSTCFRLVVTLGVCVLGCGSSATATEPASEESFTMTTTTHPAVAPVENEREEPFGPSPWLGRLERTTHSYSNGCVDHRVVDVLALAQGRSRIPVLLGWRHTSPRHEEPHFLSSRDELPANARAQECVLINGSVVTYAHQGYGGAPAYAVAAHQIEPAACPPP